MRRFLAWFRRHSLALGWFCSGFLIVGMPLVSKFQAILHGAAVGGWLGFVLTVRASRGRLPYDLRAAHEAGATTITITPNAAGDGAHLQLTTNPSGVPPERLAEMLYTLATELSGAIDAPAQNGPKPT